MPEITVDVSLNDVFEWGGMTDKVEKAFLAEVKECVTVHCEDSNIRTFAVDIDKTLKSARVVVTLAFKEEEERYHDI